MAESNTLKSQLGLATELFVQGELVSRGIYPTLPLGNYRPYDLGIEMSRGRLIKIQVKTSFYNLKQQYWKVSLKKRNGKRHQYYEPGDYDYLVAYLPLVKVYYIIPFQALPKTQSLCVAPVRDLNRGRFVAYREAWHLLGAGDQASLPPATILLDPPKPIIPQQLSLL